MATQYNFNNNTNDWFNMVSSRWYGETFVASASFTLYSVKVKVFRAGSPGNVTLAIHSVTSDLPVGTGTDSEVFSANALTTDTAGEVVEVVFSTPPDLVNGTAYAISLHGSFDASNKIGWRVNSTGGSSTQNIGNFSDDGGSTWANFDTNYIAYYEIWGTTASGPASLKTVNSLAKASVKTVNGLAIASVKTWNGLS